MPNPHIYSIMVIFRDRPLKPDSLRYKGVGVGGERGRVRRGGTLSVTKLKVITNNPRNFWKKPSLLSVSQETLSLNYLPGSGEILH